MNNSEIWNSIYETSDFGNKYPSSYLVSLFHARIKKMLFENGKQLRDMNVLDFGCSKGANSRFFSDLGMNVYGIDISERAINSIIENGIGDGIHFISCNLLNPELSIGNTLGVKFDLVIASEIMYYFKDYERIDITNKLIEMMDNSAVMYISTPTYDFSTYGQYKYIKKDQDGMVRIEESGSITEALYVNLPHDKEELKNMYPMLDVIDIMTVNTPFYSEQDMIEYIMLAKKNVNSQNN